MIEARNLHMRFNAGTPLENHAVRGVDLQVAKGEFVTLIGSNGSGKSTFMRLVTGELTPSDGQVVVDGDDVTAVARHLRARDLAVVFQDPLAGTCAELSIKENLALAAMRGEHRGLGRAVTPARREQFAAAVASLELGLEDRLDDLVGLLSGGQRQALSLIMCTLRPCKVLLLDEHTAALDPRMSEFILELTGRLYREHDLTVLMVTHSMHDALRMGGRTVMMHQGRVELDVNGAERDALDSEKMFALFARLHTRDATATAAGQPV